MLPIKFIPEVSSKLKDRELAEKTKEKLKKAKLSTNNIVDLIELIRQDVEKHLGEYEDNYKVIKDVNSFEDYIKKANKYGKIAIDTETTGLDPMNDKIVGMCLYFPGEKGVYVPINHVDYLSGERLEDQLTEEEIKPILKKLTAKIIMHNAPFDIRVILHTIGVRVTCWWETMVGAIVLNENESHALKYLHSKYISNEKEKTFSEFFGKSGFCNIPIEYAYLYAIHDAVDTFDLYEFQSRFLNEDAREDRADMYQLYRNIEIPMIDVIVDLEEVGVAVDTEYLALLNEKYHSKLQEALDKCYKEIDQYNDKLEKYNAINPINGLGDPINIGSSKQLSILFYDVLKAKEVKGKGRSTDADVMNALQEKFPLAKAIVEYRAAQKLTSTYIDNIPSIIYKDGRVHTHFNSNGAKTGRMSSSNPLNLQNIPSHNEDIRKMFIGQTTIREIETDINEITFDRCEEVETTDGWKFVESLKNGDILIDEEDGNKTVNSIKIADLQVIVGIQ